MQNKRFEKQKLEALALVGKRVRFNHRLDEPPRGVQWAHDGLVKVEGFPGLFAPHLFTVAEETNGV